MKKNLFAFGWKNTWRNKKRTLLTLTAIVVGVMGLVFVRSYMAGIRTGACDVLIKTQIGHIRIAHKEFLRLERIIPKEFMVTGTTGIKSRISGDPGIERIDERIKFNVILNSRDVNEAALAVGIDPGTADQTMGLSHWLEEGKYFGGPGASLVIGKGLAQRLGVTVNDEILVVTTDINYSTYALSFTIAGIFRTGFAELDKHVIYIPLEKAREMLACGDSAHELLLFLKDPAAAETVSENIRQQLNQAKTMQDLKIIPWQKSEFVDSFLPLVDKVMDVVFGIIMLVVGLVIMNTMLMALMERYHEIGVLKALGFRDREIFSLVIIEAFYVGMIGSIGGGTVGGAISLYMGKVGINLSQMEGVKNIWEKLDLPSPFFRNDIIYPDLTAAIYIGSVLFGILVALLAVLYPAIQSSKMSPVQAFHSNLKV